MHGFPQNGGNENSVAAQASRAISFVSGLLVTFFLLPSIHAMTVGLIESFTAQNYGGEFIQGINIGWYIVCGFLIFSSTRFVVSILIKKMGRH